MISRRNFITGLGLLPFVPETIHDFAAKEPGNSGQFSFCLNVSTIRGQNIGFLKEIEIASKAGYHGVELWINGVESYLQDGGNLKNLKKQIDDLGLRVENGIGFAQWITDDDSVRQSALEQLKREMDWLARLGCQRIAAPPAGATREPLIDLFKIAERYRTVLELGSGMGVIPQLEIWGASVNLHHLAQAMFIATAADHPDARILADVYHLFRGGSSVEALKMVPGHVIEIFHFNDYPGNIPRDRQNDSDRVYPGDGVAPLTEILKILQNAGGRKVLSLELFNKSYWSRDALEVARTGLVKMQDAVQSAREKMD